MVSHRRIVPPGDGKSQIFMPGERFTWKTVGAANGGAIDFAELLLEPGVGVPIHIHHGHEEAYYILSGTFRFKVGDEMSEAPTGAFVFIPRGTPHAWKNIGGEAGRVTLSFTPGGMSGFFEELAPILPKLMASMGDMSKVDPEVLGKFEAISRQYQYEIVGPPLT